MALYTSSSNMVASRSSDNALSFGGQPLNLPLDKSQFRTFKKKFKLASDINGAWQHHLHDIRHNIIKKFKQPNFLLVGIHHLNQPTSNFKANWMLRGLQKAWAAQSRNKDKLFTRSISRTKLKWKLGERSKGKWERSGYFFFKQLTNQEPINKDKKFKQRRRLSKKSKQARRPLPGVAKLSKKQLPQLCIFCMIVRLLASPSQYIVMIEMIELTCADEIRVVNSSSGQRNE